MVFVGKCYMVRAKTETHLLKQIKTSLAKTTCCYSPRNYNTFFVRSKRNPPWMLSGWKTWPKKSQCKFWKSFAKLWEIQHFGVELQHQRKSLWMQFTFLLSAWPSLDRSGCAVCAPSKASQASSSPATHRTWEGRRKGKTGGNENVGRTFDFGGRCVLKCQTLNSKTATNQTSAETQLMMAWSPEICCTYPPDLDQAPKCSVLSCAHIAHWQLENKNSHHCQIILYNLRNQKF